MSFLNKGSDEKAMLRHEQLITDMS